MSTGINNQTQIREVSDGSIIKHFANFQARFDVYAQVILKIKSKAGQIIPFLFNRCQRRLWTLFLEDLKIGRPIRWYIVKGRQVGTTTWCIALLYWLTTLWPNRNALILNYDEKSAENLGGKVQDLFLNCRKIMRPSVRKMNRAEIHFANPIKKFSETGEIGLNSHIDNNTIDANEIARSYTYQYVLMSEYCLYEKNLKGKSLDDQLSALYATIPHLPGTVIIKESTPFGDGQAKADWEASNGFRKIFISWVCEENYRLECPNDLVLSDVEESHYGDEIAERQSILNELEFWYPEWNNDWQRMEYECRCRLSWRRYYIDTYLQGSKNLFRQEYPTTVAHAFAGKSESIFGGFRLKEIEDQIKLNNLTCTKYRYLHNEEENDHRRKFYQTAYGHLFVYEEPHRGTTYVIGGDGAQGIDGGDESTLFVLKLPYLEEVAFFSDIIAPDKFAGIAASLGRLYNNALLGIEINDKGGFAANDHLQNTYKYPNLYYRLGASNSARTMQYGFITNDINRQIMINDMTNLVKEGHITFRSLKIIDQMKTFIQNRKTGKCEARVGAHDDAVMAPMIAVQLARCVKTFEPIDTHKGVRKYSLDWWVMQQGRNSRQSRRMSL